MIDPVQLCHYCGHMLEKVRQQKGRWPWICRKCQKKRAKERLIKNKNI